MTAGDQNDGEQILEEQIQDKFDIRNVLVEKVTGIVKWFSVVRRYGFIRRNDNNEDVFVHRSAISSFKQKYQSLKNGEKVEFSVVETANGINAASVTGPGGKPVKGARFFVHRNAPSDPLNVMPEEVQEKSVEADEVQNSVMPIQRPHRARFRGDGGRRNYGVIQRPPRWGYNVTGAYTTARPLQNGDCYEPAISPMAEAPRPRPRPFRRFRARGLGYANRGGGDAEFEGPSYQYHPPSNYAGGYETGRRFRRRGRGRPYRRASHALDSTNQPHRDALGHHSESSVTNYDARVDCQSKSVTEAQEPSNSELSPQSAPVVEAVTNKVVETVEEAVADKN